MKKSQAFNCQLFSFSSSVLAFLPSGGNRLATPPMLGLVVYRNQLGDARDVEQAIHTPLRLAYLVPALPVQHGLFAAAVAADPWDPTSQHRGVDTIVPAALRAGVSRSFSFSALIRR
jgi:hypothetical protein